MQCPREKYFKTGLIHFMAYPSTSGGEGPILETLERILADDYFSAVTVTWMKDPGVRRKAREMLEQSHIEIVYGAHPSLLSTGLNPNDLNEEGRLKAVNELKRGIEEAHELGAGNFVFFGGKYDPHKKEEALSALIRSTLELCEHTEARKGPRVCLEIFDHEIDKRSLIGPAVLAKRYADEVSAQSGRIGLITDLSHIPLIGESPREAILPIRDHLTAVDIGNCVLADKQSPWYGDNHPWFGCPSGSNDVPQLMEFLKVLWEIGFLNPERRPTVSFEVKPRPNERPEIVIANAKRTLNEAWARLDME
jgi:sugar phosphate isomerase/epimerase